MKLKITVLLLAMAVLFSGCPFGSEDEDENPLLGKWVFTSYTEIYYEDGTLDETLEETYNPVVNGRLKVYQFRSSKVYHFHRFFA